MGAPQRLRSAFLGAVTTGPPSCTQPGSAQIQDLGDYSLPNLRESLSLPPTRPLGLELANRLSFLQKDRKSIWLQAALAFCLENKKSLRQKTDKELGDLLEMG